jgi:outer membrane protein TolC
MCEGSLGRLTALVALIVLATAPLCAQTPPPTMERLTFDEAVQRALKNNPTIAQAAEAVLRAEGLLQQARSATLLNVAALITNIQLDTGRTFSGAVVQPRNQTTFLVEFTQPVLAAARWAAASQARDQVNVANLSTADVRTQIALAAGQAYLAIIDSRSQLEVNQSARDVAQEHLDYARRRLAEGAGTRLNELRAAQEVSNDEARAEVAALAVRRAQEALGVLVAANGPVDAAAVPMLEVPSDAEIKDENAWMAMRSDVRLATATERALNRVWRDSFKDYIPTVFASFDPSALVPSSIFTAPRGWRLNIAVAAPIFDSGQRRGVAKVRESAANAARFDLVNVQIEAHSEVRVDLDSVQSLERALASQRLSAQQAQEVVTITEAAFEAGASTNIEVIDAQRASRDAETAVALAESAVRRARLDLLKALGRFP